MTLSLTFDAVAEPQPGAKWRARWDLSWPDYEAWFRRRGGDAGPDLSACEAALARHMPELVPVHARLAGLAGGGDRAARFLSGWCPPEYLGGCSVAAHTQGGTARLIRNYDLAPDLNEGLLFNSAWTGRPVMGMVEFLWGLSDGVNADGLAAAIAYGGRRKLGEGFGITHILRYVLETCRDVAGALDVLARVPSHMAYNVVLADRSGAKASVELAPGAAMRRVVPALATNHQHGGTRADRPGFTRTVERRAHLEMLLARDVPLAELRRAFLRSPLFQTDHAGGFGTLFTAEYAPDEAAMALSWPGARWNQSLADFREGSRRITYASAAPPREADLAEVLAGLRPHIAAGAGAAFDAWLVTARQGEPDWTGFGRLFAGPPEAPARHG